MLRQYYCSPFRYASIQQRHLHIGVIPIGSIYRLYRERRARYTVERDHIDTIIVEAWLPRECGAGRFDKHSGLWVDSYHATGMFIAKVRSLANGKRYRITDHALHHAEEIF